MSKRRWGAPTWMFMHTLIAHVKPDTYPLMKRPILDHIRRIASVLPCPECSMHATNYLRNVDSRRLPTKESFIDMLWTFHNTVNLRLGSSVSPRSTLELYKKANMQYMYRVFSTEYTRPLRNIRLIAEDTARRGIIGNMTQWLRANHQHFSL